MQCGDVAPRHEFVDRLARYGPREVWRSWDRAAKRNVCGGGGCTGAFVPQHSGVYDQSVGSTAMPDVVAKLKEIGEYIVGGSSL